MCNTSSTQRITICMKEQIICSGALFYAKDTGRILLLQKANGKHKSTWGLVGGKNTKSESAWQGLQREITEEIGQVPTIIKSIPLETFISNDNLFNFHTYLCVVPSEFIPTLSDEHVGWAWATIDNCPKPLHQGLRRSFGSKVIQSKLDTIFSVISFF